MLVGISPLRISFAGGGTDMPEYYESHIGLVVSTTISRFTYVIIHDRHDSSFQAFSPDFQKHYKPTSFDKIEVQDGTEISASVIKYFNFKKGINVIIFSDVQAGSGLGTSGALAVNFVNTITKSMNKNWSNEKIAEIAYKIEREVLHWPIGKQDEYSAAFGGLNFLKFDKKRVNVIPIKLSKSSKRELEQNLLLFFVGKTRNSSRILNAQIKLIKEKNKDTIESLNYTKELAQKMYNSLKKSDITNFGYYLHEGWMAKRKFTRTVSNQKIDKIYHKALKSGAIGGKLTGAGGGGHMLLYCDIKKQKNLISEMKKLGLTQVNFKLYNKGSSILNLYDYMEKQLR